MLRKFSSSLKGGAVLPTAIQAQKPLEIWPSTRSDKNVTFSGPRFEQTDLTAQPSPLSAMEMISQEPIKSVSTRIASCDGGGGALGHPKVYMNLDNLKPKSCGYCGNRFVLDNHHH